MASDDFIAAVLQDRDGTEPSETYGVDGIEQSQLLEHAVDDPDLLLGRRGEQRRVAWHTGDRPRRLARPRLKRRLDLVSEPGDRGCFEEAE